MKRKWFAALICLGLFLLIALNLENVAWLDGPVYQALARLRSPAATAFFLFCTQLVSPLVLLLIALGLVITIPRREFRIPILLNLCVAVLLNLGLKHVFSRPRPTDVVRIVTEAGSSFPSGHTMAAACFYGFLIWLIWRLCKSRALRQRPERAARAGHCAGGGKPRLSGRALLYRRNRRPMRIVRVSGAFYHRCGTLFRA